MAVGSSARQPVCMCLAEQPAGMSLFSLGFTVELGGEERRVSCKPRKSVVEFLLLFSSTD